MQQKNKSKRNYFQLACYFFALVFFSSCSTKKGQDEPKFDLDDINKKGKLTVLMDNSALSYFEYKGKNLGFEYEILDSFARSIGLKLEVKIIQNRESFLRSLNNGEGDIIACSQAITLPAIKDMDFSLPFYTTHQVLVQAKSVDSLLVKEASDLGGKNVYVVKGSAFDDRLKNLSDEIGVVINRRYIESDVNAEDLIEMVASKKINYCLANENLARISNDLHDNINTKTIISTNQKIAFGLRKNNPQLKAKLNAFLSNYCISSQFNQLKKRYFDYMVQNPVIETIPLKKGRFSPYDELFKSAASKFGWDWKIIAAISCKESNFNPNARGLGGAFGLMQFMPNTGAHYGVYPNSTPEVQINGAMVMINKVYNSWSSIPDTEQRMKFTLASYNAGKGHIDDAQRLAVKNGLNPLIWDGNVQVMVKNLAVPAFYRDPVVRCGAYRGPASKYATAVYQKYLSWK
jgi:membrane-bound lytic murein transglycosylase F